MAVTSGDFDKGFSSPHWMLKALVATVDPRMLRFGVQSMINYFVYNPEVSIDEAFDVLAQTMTTGQYEDVGIAHEHEFTDEEIADQVRRFREQMDKGLHEEDE